MRALAAAGATDVDVGYSASVTRLIEVPADALHQVEAALADATAGRATMSYDEPSRP